MSKNVQHMPISIAGTSFCFKYCINLGNDRFGTMTVNQKTDLYKQAERFCENYGLEPHVAIILENQMFQEILKIKGEIVTKSPPVAATVGKIHKNTQSKEKLYTQGSQTLSNCPTIKDRYKTLADNEQDTKTHKIAKNQTINDTEKKTAKRQSISKHFQQMFKRHEQIQNKKELSRKASLQKIPFKPTINNLSRKIVDLKRSTMSRTGQNQNYTHKIYTKNVNKQPTSKSRDKFKQNMESSFTKTKRSSQQTKSKTKLR